MAKACHLYIKQCIRHALFFRITSFFRNIAVESKTPNQINAKIARKIFTVAGQLQPMGLQLSERLPKGTRPSRYLPFACFCVITRRHANNLPNKMVFKFDATLPVSLYLLSLSTIFESTRANIALLPSTAITLLYSSLLVYIMGTLKDFCQSLAGYYFTGRPRRQDSSNSHHCKR